MNGPLLPEQTTQSRTDVVAQRLLIRLKTFKSEWFLDVDYGVPWLQQILGKKISKASLDLILQEQILLENGVKELVSFSSTFKNRAYSMTFSIKVNTGDVVTLTVTPII